MARTRPVFPYRIPHQRTDNRALVNRGRDGTLAWADFQVAMLPRLRRRLVPGSKNAFATAFLPGDDLVFQELGGCVSPGVLFTTPHSPLAPSNFASSSLARTVGDLAEVDGSW
jgi:hypothetical protein